MRRLSRSDIQYRPYLHMLPWEDSVDQIYNTDPIYICYHEKTQSIRYTIPTLSTYVTTRRLSQSDVQLQTLSTYITMRRLSSSDIQYRPYLHMLPREDSVDQIYNYRPYLHILPSEDSVDQIYNTDPIYICYHEKTQSIRCTITGPIYIYYHEKTQSIRYTIPIISTYVTKRRLSESDIQYRPYLHILPMRRLSQSDIEYRPYLHILPWEDSVDQIYNTDPIYICYQEKTQSIRYTIPTLSTYVTTRRLSRSDIQYRPYLHMLPREDSVNQMYNYRPYLHILPCEDSVHQIYNTTLYTYVSTRRLSRSDIQLTPHLHILPSEDSVDQIYNTDPIYICYHEKTQSIRCTITGPIYIYYHEKTQSIRYTITGPIYIYYHANTKSIRYTIPTLSTSYHEKTQSIRYTIPTLSIYVTTRRLSWSDIQLQALSTYITMWRLISSDIQYQPYLHILPREDSVNQTYKTDHIYICYQEKTQWIRCTIPTLSTYVTMRRFNQSDIQYRPYLHMLPWEDSVSQIYNTDPIYQCLNEKTQFIRYTMPNLCTYATMIRLSRSDIQYRLYLHMLPREDSVNQIYNTDPIYIYYPWEDSVNQIYNTDPIYIYYHEKTQSIRYTIPTLSTYVTKRRLGRSDIQYRPYPHMLPKEDSVDQIYNTDPLYICYHEKTQSIRCTITGPIYIYYHEKTQSIRYTITGPIYKYYIAKTKSIRYTIPTLSTCYHEKTQSIRYTIIGPI